MDAREMLLKGQNPAASKALAGKPGEGEANEGGGGPNIGARARRDQIEFRPSQGWAVSIEYHNLLFEEIEPRYSEMILYFTTHIIKLTAHEGHSLEGLLKRIKSHMEDRVEISVKQDALRAAAGMPHEKPKYPVKDIQVVKNTK